MELSSDEARDAEKPVVSIDADEIDDLPGRKRQSDDELELGEIFELLKNKRRRRVITFLKEQEDGVTRLNELAEHIAALENGIDVAQLSSSQRKRVYIGLYQCHLPKMDDFGVIDFQKNRGIITLRDTSQLDPYLLAEEDDTENDDASESDGDVESGLAVERRTNLLAAVAFVTAVIVGMTGVGPLAAVPAVGWTAISLLAVVVFAAT